MLASRNIEERNVWAGVTKQFDNLGLEVIYPLTDQTGVQSTSQHDATVVVRLTTGSATALLTGDLETEQEKRILAAYCPDQQRPCPRLKTDLLKVPHHGSKTGLEPDFLAAIAPKQAIISNGEKNPYGHPHPITLDRLAAAAVATWRTDLQGTISAQISASGWLVTAEK